MTEEITPCGRTRDFWNFKEGETFRGANDFGLTRDYFDCGTYFFDGMFNVIKFPKGMSIYHGSAVLANALAEFPAGIRFYDQNGRNVPVDLNIAVTSEDDIEELMVQAGANIVPSWYGDLDIAKLYSNTRNYDRLCGDRCVFAFKLKKDCVFFNLNNDYNIAKILAERSVPVEQKTNLINMFGLSDLNRYNPSTLNEDIIRNHLTLRDGNNIKFVNKNRNSSRAWDIPFGSWLCGSVIQTFGYSGYAAEKQITTNHGGQFHLEIVFCDPFKWLSRDYNNINDWQHSLGYDRIPDNDLRKIYIEQLKLYDTTNVNWHAGNLYEHSVWTLLFSEYLMNNPYYRWFNYLENNTKKITAFIAFIHDIGKMFPIRIEGLDSEIARYNGERKVYVYNAIREHPLIGENYINGELPFPIMNNETNTVAEYMNINNLFNSFGLELDEEDLLIYKQIASKLIGMHWDFGDRFVRPVNQDRSERNIQTRTNNFLNFVYTQVKNNLPVINEPVDFKIFITMLIVISLADILATQPFGVNRFENNPGEAEAELNKRSVFFPFIKNVSKNYKGGPVSEGIDETIINLSGNIIDMAENYFEQQESRMDVDV